MLADVGRKRTPAIILKKQKKMNALDLGASISEAKQEIEREYEEGSISQEERDWRMDHILGY